MEKKIKSESLIPVYAVEMMHDCQVYQTEMFESRNDALRKMYEHALAVKEANNLNTIMEIKNKVGAVYGLMVKNKGCVCHFRIHMNLKFVNTSLITNT